MYEYTSKARCSAASAGGATHNLYLYISISFLYTYLQGPPERRFFRWRDLKHSRLAQQRRRPA